MGRELQKKKNRSSIAKVRQKPKSKKVHPRGNATVAANWDHSLTLSQNYQRLGLTSQLNARTGGVEKRGSYLSRDVQTAKSDQDPLAVRSKTAKTLIPSIVRVERDLVTGAIRRVVRDPSTNPNPLNDPLNELSEDESAEDQTQPDQRSGVVHILEEEARLEAPKQPRKQSAREVEWISSLVAKYGEDYSRMARDRKLNPNQQTEADIRRRVLKWKGLKS